MVCNCLCETSPPAANDIFRGLPADTPAWEAEVEAPASMRLALRDGSRSAAAWCIHSDSPRSTSRFRFTRRFRQRHVETASDRPFETMTNPDFRRRPPNRHWPPLRHGRLAKPRLSFSPLSWTTASTYPERLAGFVIPPLRVATSFPPPKYYGRRQGCRGLGVESAPARASRRPRREWASAPPRGPAPARH